MYQRELGSGESACEQVQSTRNDGACIGDSLIETLLHSLRLYCIGSCNFHEAPLERLLVR